MTTFCLGGWGALGARAFFVARGGGFGASSSSSDSEILRFRDVLAFVLAVVVAFDAVFLEAEAVDFGGAFLDAGAFLGAGTFLDIGAFFGANIILASM